MGRFFTSFDEAWSAFLQREEPLEDFYAPFPDEPDATVDAWLLVPGPAVTRAALDLQRAFANLPWLVMIPEHFLHVSLRDDVDWTQAPPLTLRYARVNCFHDAVVAEVQCDELRRFVGDPLFLPHLSVAYVAEPREPGAVREALVGVRDSVLGEETASEVLRCRVPVSKATLLQPWQVLERVRLEQTSR